MIDVVVKEFFCKDEFGCININWIEDVIKKYKNVKLKVVYLEIYKIFFYVI